ncbi:MAG: hypothetical protein IJJ23_03105 [Clostridia bacterium]|nr:hypothetical protein [Clostridia bacterium]
MSEKSERHFIRPWGYVGYSILFCIPVIGWIWLIVMTFSKRRNKRYYARSYWCRILLCLIISIVLALAGFIFTRLEVGKEFLEKTTAFTTAVVDEFGKTFIDVKPTTPDEPIEQADPSATAAPVTETTETAETQTATSSDPVIQALTGSWSTSDGRYTYTFNADATGKYELFSGTTVMDFTYTATAEELSILYKDRPEPLVLPYSIEGDTLNLTDSFGAVVAYTKK